MTAMVAMREDDVNEAAELHRRGVLNLRAATWALAVFRRQRGKELTPAEVMKRFGASRTNAYRVVSEMKFALESTHRRFPETGTGEEENKDSRPPGSTHQEFPETGTETHKPFPDSRNPGFPESGTICPGNRDGSHYMDSGIQGEIDIRGPRQQAPLAGTGGEAGWVRAAAILSESPQAYPLGDYLARNAHLDEVRSLSEDTAKGKYPAGWRLESAALIFLSPRTPDDVRSCRNCRASLNYLLQIARGQTRPYVPPSLSIVDAPRPTGTDPRPRRRGPDIDSMNFGD